MNQFNFNKTNFLDSFIFSIVVAAALLLASNISNKSHYMVFVTAAAISFLPYFYFSFFEKEPATLRKWLPRSAMLFYQLSFMSALAYFDSTLLGLK